MVGLDSVGFYHFKCCCVVKPCRAHWVNNCRDGVQHTLNTDKIQLLLEDTMYSADYKPGYLGNAQEIIN